VCGPARHLLSHSPGRVRGAGCCDRWFIYYSTRIGDDAHWGKNISGLKFNVDGGFYMEAMRDLKFVAGNGGMTFMRGPFFSNVLSTESTKKGHFDLSSMSEAEKRDRLFFGAAIPSVRALNGRPDPADVVSRGGMHGPLSKMVEGLADAFRAKLSEHTGNDLPKLSAVDLKRKLQHLASESNSEEAATMSAAVPVYHKMPKAGWGEEGAPWWALPSPDADVAHGARERETPRVEDSVP